MMNMQLIINVNNAEELQSITNALNGINNLYVPDKGIIDNTILPKEEEFVKSAVVPTAEPKDEVKAKAVPVAGAIEPSLTYDDCVREATNAMVRNQSNGPRIRDILNRLEVSKMSDLVGDGRAAFIREVRAL